MRQTLCTSCLLTYKSICDPQNRKIPIIMHLSLASNSPGVDLRDTHGIPRGLVGDYSILGKKLCPRGWGIVRLLQGMLNPRGMHPRDLFCLGQRFSAHCNSRGNMRPWQLFRFKLVLHCRLGSCGKLSIKFSIILGRILLTLF